MADVQLADLLASYPPQDDPEIQTLVAAKEEFRELASSPRERLPGGRGKLLRHQEMVKRLLREWDQLALLHETGTGKTCSALGFTEWAVEERRAFLAGEEKRGIGSGGHFRHVYILVSGPTQVNEVKRQLVCRCSDGRYETELVRRAKSEKAQKANVTREIGHWYTVTTYEKYAGRINSKYGTAADNENLMADFDDCIFWIDEAHNLRIEEKRWPEIRPFSFDPQTDLPTLTHDKERIYYQIWRVLHLARRSKKIISTATPMINSPGDLGSVMNLVLPLERQFPPSFDFERATIEEYEPYLRGVVSYVAAAQTGAVPKFEGLPDRQEYYDIPGYPEGFVSQSVLYFTTMSEFQTEAYLRAEEYSRGESSVYGPEVQAANFVFPDGRWGAGLSGEEEAEKRRQRREAKEAKRVVESLRGKTPTRRGRRTPRTPDPSSPRESGAYEKYVEKVGTGHLAVGELADYLQPGGKDGLLYVRFLSTKFAEIVRLCRDGPGNCFVYGRLVGGSGIVVLGLIFEAMGFERFDEPGSVFVSLEGLTIKPYCDPGASGGSGGSETGEGSSRALRAGFEPAPRYALLTGKESSEARNSAILELFNSPENRHGDYIKILIASEVGRDAINVSNVLQIHLVAPEWNQSNIYQALSRGLRATSHVDLIREEEERLRRAGRDPSLAEIEVKIYKHAAVPDQDIAPGVTGIDVRMYRIAETKDVSIRRVLRILKRLAIDCPEHRARNILRDPRLEGKAPCDYAPCDYSCYPTGRELPSPVDFGTFDVLYPGAATEEATVALRRLFRDRPQATFGALRRALPAVRPNILAFALERLVTERLPVPDRFGYVTYLREDRGAFYLDRNFPVSDRDSSVSLAAYGTGVVGLRSLPLADLAAGLEQNEQNRILADLHRTDPKSPEFLSLLNSLNIPNQAALVEDTVSRIVLEDTWDDRLEAIYYRFKLLIFGLAEGAEGEGVIHEPLARLAAVEREATRTDKRGRKKNPDVKRRTKRTKVASLSQYNPDTGTEPVFLHTLYTLVSDRTNYSAPVRFDKAEGRLRLLKPSEGVWRDCNGYEYTVYNTIIQLLNGRRRSAFEEFQIYGTILGGKFRILDSTTEDERASSDPRFRRRGRECRSWKKEDLVDLLWKIGGEEGSIPPAEVAVPRDRKATIAELLRKKINYPREEVEEWPEERLAFYYSWYLAREGNRLLKKERLCDIIQEFLRENGRLLEVSPA